MNVQIKRIALDEVDTEVLALGLLDEPRELPTPFRETTLGTSLAGLISAEELGLGVGDVTPILGFSGDLKAKSLVTIGLGTTPRLDAGNAFAAGVALAKRLASKPRESVALAIPALGSEQGPGLVSALIEGFVVGTRGPDLRKSEPARKPIGSLTLVIPPGTNGAVELEKAVRRGSIVGEAVNLARDLINTPPSEKSPPRLAEIMCAAAVSAGIEVEVWDQARIRHERLGGILGVAAGSEEPPSLLRFTYRRGGPGDHLALVGKGVTFDSGGLSLKPSSSMEDMKCDMTGAAVVLATLIAIARLELPVNVVGYTALTENMTGGKAMKLGDVLTIRNGKTVEVLNTDAEGRLILADALSIAVEDKPARLLDLATLTGACMVALGAKVAGLFSNNDTFADEVASAARATGERVWRLPLDDDYKDQLKSHVADLKNVGGKYAGAITAAKFLEAFVAATPWVHLDIAGPSWSDSDSSTRDPGGTGCFVRSLVTLIERSAT